MGERTRPDEATRETERREANAQHVPGPEPTPDEERAAEAAEFDPQVEDAYREATERGAHLQGEGRID